MRRIDPVGTILGSSALLLFVLLPALWIADAYSALRNGRAGEPVTVALDAPVDAAAVTVSRISPRGNRVALPNVPGRPLWPSGHEWFADLELATDGATLAQIRAVVVTIGSRRFEYTGDELRERWTKAAQEQIDRVVLHPPAELRAERSRLERFATLRNWPGDAAVVGDLVGNVRAWRVALLCA